MSAVAPVAPIAPNVAVAVAPAAAAAPPTMLDAVKPPMAPTSSQRRSIYDLDSEESQFLIADGTKLKASMLLTSDWANLSIKELKSYMAKRWGVAPEQLTIGGPRGWYHPNEAPNDACLVGQIAAASPHGPKEVYLWPAEGNTLAAGNFGRQRSSLASSTGAQSWGLSALSPSSAASGQQSQSLLERRLGQGLGSAQPPPAHALRAAEEEALAAKSQEMQIKRSGSSGTLSLLVPQGHVQDGTPSPAVSMPTPYATTPMQQLQPVQAVQAASGSQSNLGGYVFPTDAQSATASFRNTPPDTPSLPSRKQSQTQPSRTESPGTVPQGQQQQQQQPAARKTSAESNNSNRSGGSASRKIAEKIRDHGIVQGYSEIRQSMDLWAAAATPEEIAYVTDGLWTPAEIEKMLSVDKRHLHAFVAKIVQRLPVGPVLETLLTGLEGLLPKLFETPELFTATFARMSEERRRRVVAEAVGLVVVFSERPRAGLGLEACVRLQSTEGAPGGISVVQPLLQEVLKQSEILMRSSSGNYLVQQCISHGPTFFADEIAKKCKGVAESMSLNRHASHVMEKVLKRASPAVLGDLLKELIRSSVAAGRLARSQSGNYVLQVAISLIPRSFWETASARIKACLPDLTSIAADRVWSRLCDRAQAENLPLDMTLNYVPVSEAEYPTQSANPAHKNGTPVTNPSKKNVDAAKGKKGSPKVQTTKRQAPQLQVQTQMQPQGQMLGASPQQPLVTPAMSQTELPSPSIANTALTQTPASSLASFASPQMLLSPHGFPAATSPGGMYGQLPVQPVQTQFQGQQFGQQQFATQQFATQQFAAQQLNAQQLSAQQQLQSQVAQVQALQAQLAAQAQQAGAPVQFVSLPQYQPQTMQAPTQYQI